MLGNPRNPGNPSNHAAPNRKVRLIRSNREFKQMCLHEIA